MLPAALAGGIVGGLAGVLVSTRGGVSMPRQFGGGVVGGAAGTGAGVAVGAAIDSRRCRRWYASSQPATGA